MKKIILLILTLASLACGVTVVPLAGNQPEISRNQSDVSTVPAIATQTPVNAPNKCYGIVTAGKLNLRADADYLSPADGAGLVRNEIVYIISTVGDWYKVRTDDGREGYAHAEYVSRPGCK